MTNFFCFYQLHKINKNICAIYNKDVKNVLRISVYGQVAAGIPIEAIEDIDDYEDLDASTVTHGEYIALRIKGHRMEPKISEVDVVIVHMQDNVDSRKIKKTTDGVMLISTKTVYDPILYSNRDIEELPVRILGRAVDYSNKNLMQINCTSPPPFPQFQKFFQKFLQNLLTIAPNRCII